MSEKEGNDKEEEKSVLDELLELGKLAQKQEFKEKLVKDILWAYQKSMST